MIKPLVLAASLIMMIAPSLTPAAPYNSGLGNVIDLGFDSKERIKLVLVQVKNAWIHNGRVSLDIEINGLNGVPAFHGRETILVSSGIVFNQQRDVAEVVLDWYDPVFEGRNVGEVYTVCTQALVNDKPLTELSCADFCFDSACGG